MHIREATASDAPAIARTHVDSWRTTYRKILSDAFLDGLSYSAREAQWRKRLSEQRVFVAENEHRAIIGFALGGAERSGKYTEQTGELYALYLLESEQGRGLGK
ncbi:MAG: GNAT family N-acetyltransferase [Bacilli bacterium]